MPEPEKAPRRGRFWGWVGKTLFVLFLAAGLAGVVLFLRQTALPDLSGLLPGQEAEGNSPNDYNDDRFYSKENWPMVLEKTSIPLYPSGDRVVIDLEEPGEAISPVDMYQQVSPSVVGIRAMGETSFSTGTGVILTEDGYIVTNAHLIAGQSQAAVIFSGGMMVEARLVGYDGPTDLAVLKVEASGLSAASFGDSDLLRVGEEAYAIGNPLGESLRGTMTEGIISAVKREMTTRNGTMNLIQTSAALNSGNSGGALLNASGQVVGITNMKMMSTSETIEGLGFAIPMTLVKSVAEQIIASGSYEGQPILGVTVQTCYDEEGNPMGSLVAAVREGTDAEAKGILPGEVIVGAGGAPVRNNEDLLAAKKGLRVGDGLTLVILSPEGEREVTVILGSDRD